MAQHTHGSDIILSMKTKQYTWINESVNDVALQYRTGYNVR